MRRQQHPVFVAWSATLQGRAQGREGAVQGRIAIDNAHQPGASFCKNLRRSIPAKRSSFARKQAFQGNGTQECLLQNEATPARLHANSKRDTETGVFPMWKFGLNLGL